MARNRGDAAQVVEGRDTVGWGSNCRWSHQMQSD
jgi:hypothetical protein